MRLRSVTQGWSVAHPSLPTTRDRILDLISDIYALRTARRGNVISGPFGARIDLDDVAGARKKFYASFVPVQGRGPKARLHSFQLLFPED